MSKYTFITVREVGPAYPVPNGIDPKEWALYLRGSCFNVKHRAGRWSADAISRLVRKSGVELIRAYSLNHDGRHGYAGAIEHKIL